MTLPANESRRRFLRTSAAGGGLLLGVSLSGCDQSAAGKALIRKIAAEDHLSTDFFLPSVFINIAPTDIITIEVPSSEMGQGVMTSLPMIIADEMEADWTNIRTEFAPAHKAFANPYFRSQLTGGSQSIHAFWQPLRQAGAQAKTMLLQAAALTWEVNPQECYATQGTVIHKPSGRKLSYGKLANKAASLTLPGEVPLKANSEFTLVGKPQPRLDIPAKISGQAVFGIDVKLDKLLTACMVKSPVLGDKLQSFDANKAKTIAGVRHVVTIDSGVAVVADHYWAASRGCDALQIQWQTNGNASVANRAASTSSIRDAYIQQLRHAKTVREVGDVNQTLQAAERTLTAVYETPFLAHACMEPMNCTAYVQDNRCDVWVPTQAQGNTQKTAANITGLDKEQVFVHTTYLGGGFGRRSELDFVTDAVQISKAIKEPVKLIWNREQDLQHDFYRPASYNALRAAVDDQGWPVAWSHDIASQSILERLLPLPAILLRGVDPTAIEGASHLPYNIANFKVRYAMAHSPVPVGFWRSVGNSNNGFISECFLDEVAALGGKDPLELRLHLLKDQPRYLRVLQLAADKARWQDSPPQGIFRGIALVKSFSSYVAQVAEITLDGKPGDQTVNVRRVICAVDCGLVVNPNTVRAQLESAVIYGLTAALYGNINIVNGGVQQTNFNDYLLLPMKESPEIEVHIIHNTEDPQGVGEIGVPPIAPAVANAVFAATGKPIRRLPIQLALNAPH
jgi:isoquinoline 1-oxidoreductase beta subunit